MTRRERLEAVIRGEISEELIESCREELKKLDAQSARANERAKESENYKKNKVYEERVLRELTEEPITIEVLMERIGWTGSRQKLTAICTNLARAGYVRTTDVKIKGKGFRRAYYV